MNALATTNPSMQFLKDHGLVTHHANPSPENGPVIFYFEPAATHPGAETYETYAAAATLSQKGQTLATFKAVAIGTLHNLRSEAHYREEVGILDKLPQLGSYEDLLQAFGYFYLSCWKLTWDALEHRVPTGHTGYKSGDWLQSNGLLQVVHSGLLNHVERQFFHASLPDDKLRKSILEKHESFTTLCHPYGIHPLCTLFTGMGYRSNLEEQKKAIGFSYIAYDIVNEAAANTALYWAAKNRDSRLATFIL